MDKKKKKKVMGLRWSKGFRERAERVGEETDMCSLSHNLQEALGLPTGVGSNDSLAGNSEGEEVLGTKETQGEEEEEETTSPISSSNPFPSPSPTPEDTISYICEYSEARMACVSTTDPYVSQTYQGSSRSAPPLHACQEPKLLNLTYIVQITSSTPSLGVGGPCPFFPLGLLIVPPFDYPVPSQWAVCPAWMQAYTNCIFVCTLWTPVWSS